MKFADIVQSADWKTEKHVPAIEVPESAAILFVPKMVGSGALGKVTSKAGSWIKPPPPTTESIKPAIKARIDNINNVNRL